MMAKVLAYGPLGAPGTQVLKLRNDIELVTVAAADLKALHREVASAQAVIARYLPFDRETIKLAQNLKVVARVGVGYDNIDLDALTERGIPLATVGDANSTTVAEHTLYLMLALAKKGINCDQASRTGNWKYREKLTTFELEKKTLLIVGLGRIGRRVAERCAAFGMHILAYDPYVSSDEIIRRGANPVYDLNNAIAESDIVSLHVPATSDTYQIINNARLRLFKSSALLINTARGSLVDETALCDALHAGRLAGAGIDVFTTEPPCHRERLFTFENVVISPHTAGLTEECISRMGIICANHAIAAIDGCLDYTYVVNPDVLEQK